MEQVAPLLAATLADRYELRETLGSGGMATVFLAEDRKHHRDVAIKVLRPDVAAQLGPERFLREIRIAARLTHPHILPLIDSGEAAGSLYYVMPFVAGSSLRQRLLRDGRLPLEDAVTIARDVSAALDYVHRQGFVHRDVKPENILFVDDLAVVADFGIARALSAAGPDTVTQGGIAVGTPSYMSPEQAAGEQELDARSDLYSLACVLYEMLTGNPPFAGASARAVMARHVTESPAPLRSLRPEVSVGVEHALGRALAKDPVHRFASIAEFGAALETSDAVRIGPDPPARDRSIAVLPFVNTSADPENEYFSDGMTDELINTLAKVDGLRVASRASVFVHKGKAQDVRAIAAMLGVSTVLDGTVRKSGDRLRITAQLSAADDGRLLWSERYDRKLDDVFAIQDEIAYTIVTTLRRRLLADIADPAPHRYTANLRAYALYLKGRFCWNQRSREGLVDAIDYFEQAIAEDPDSALAYSGLSDAYALQVDYRGVPVTEGFERARLYARRALELDETLAEAHSSLGWVLYIHDWDWDAASVEFRRAIELNPRYATAHQWYSWLALVQGNAEQALAEGHAALELDRSSVSIRRSLGWTYYYLRRYDESARHLRHAIAMNPTSEENQRILGLVLMQQGEHADAERAFREAISLSEELAYATAGLGHLLATTGRRAEAEVLLAELEARARERYVSPVAFCILTLGLGDVDGSFLWLERAHEQRRGWLAYLDVEPLFDPIRSDPRFAEMRTRMKLPVVSRDDGHASSS